MKKKEVHKETKKEMMSHKSKGPVALKAKIGSKDGHKKGK